MLGLLKPATVTTQSQVNVIILTELFSQCVVVTCD